MKRLDPGMLARSKAGHDNGKVFVIIREDGEYVYLVDGITRKLEDPKKKCRKHIQIIYDIPVSLKEKFTVNQKIINEDIKRALKEYKECQVN